MRLDDLDPSNNVRDLGSGGMGGGGGIPLLGLLPLFMGRLGCGGFAILGLIALAYVFMGGGNFLGGGGTPVGRAPQGQGSGVCNTEARLFACRVLTSTEQTWAPLVEQAGGQYQPATLNFYQRGAQSGCGAASSAMGPFYCPGDQGVYLDTSFFDELAQRYGARGDFAQAYVIAHEIGHHIQNLTGTAGRVTQLQQRSGRTEGNRLSVMLELQADCYAGVWAARNRNRLEPGDIEEGMTAANAIGDDTLQRQSQGAVVPDSFTHGSSADRMRWLRRGLETGDPAACDTFDGALG